MRTHSKTGGHIYREEALNDAIHRLFGLTIHIDRHFESRPESTQPGQPVQSTPRLQKSRVASPLPEQNTTRRHSNRITARHFPGRRKFARLRYAKFLSSKCSCIRTKRSALHTHTCTSLTEELSYKSIGKMRPVDRNAQRPAVYTGYISATATPCAQLPRRCACFSGSF